MSWYKTGTLNVTKNSKKVTGTGTKWTNSLVGICAGQMLILKTQNTIEIYEIASVQSDTELTLAKHYDGETKSGLDYEIPTVPKVSIEALALRISEMLNYYQQQMEGWQTALTGEGEVTVTAPDGRVVTIKSQYSIQKELIKLVEQGKDFAQSASESATTATDASESAKSYADSASASATASHNSAQQSSNSANAASSSERNAKTSEMNAAKSAEDAKSWASTVDNSNFIKKTGADSQSIDGELTVGTLSANEKINASEILENGNRVYSPNNKPDADTVGALPVVKIADNEISTYSVDDNVDFKKIPTVGGKSVITDLTDVNNKIELIKTKLGDFRLMPFRANELPHGWYFRNGDNYLLHSPQGQALNRLSDNYKRDHLITIKNINGQQYINVPSAFASDGRGFFERAVDGTTRQVGTVEGDSMRQLSGCFLGFNETGNNIDNMFYADERYIFDASGSQQNRALNLAWNVFDNNRVNNPVSNENKPLNIGLTPVIYLGV